VHQVEGSSEDDGGAWIRVRGPLGVTRIAHTQILRATAPAGAVGGVLEGRAVTQDGTVANVVWSLGVGPRGTRVALTIDVAASGIDRVLLTIGGRRWLEQRLLRAALEDLSAAIVPREL
jgi:hypothetical protein